MHYAGGRKNQTHARIGCSIILLIGGEGGKKKWIKTLEGGGEGIEIFVY